MIARLYDLLIPTIIQRFELLRIPQLAAYATSAATIVNALVQAAYACAWFLVAIFIPSWVLMFVFYRKRVC